MKPLALRLPSVGIAALACLVAACSPNAADNAAKETAEKAAEAADASADVATAAAGATTDAADAATTALVVDPAAIEALEKMSAYLRTLKSFEMEATTTADTVLESGQLVQFGGKVIYRVRQPDAVQVVWDTDRKHRTLYYDGKNLTLYAPRMKYYAQTEAPPTIKETAVLIEDKLGLDLPLVDLFRWGTDSADTASIASGIVVGPATINGARCMQYAFNQNDVDWQIFIQEGDKPVPCKIVITTLSDEARPQFSATLNWKENPSFSPAIFTFTPGKDDQRIKIAEVQS
jgi:hypothetical protein